MVLFKLYANFLLESGRMLFWFDSVLGRPSQSQRSIYFLIEDRTGLIVLVISEGDGQCPALKFQKEKENRWAIVAEEKEIT